MPVTSVQRHKRKYVAQMNIQTTTPDTSRYQDEFLSLRDHLPGQDLPWMKDLRTAAMDAFAGTGLPTLRDESWKYTNLHSLSACNFKPANSIAGQISIDHAPRLMPGASGCFLMTFVNGRLRLDLSSFENLPAGVTLLPFEQLADQHPERFEQWFATALQREINQPMVSLNTALMSTGYVLHIEKGVTLHEPVEILNLSAATPQAFSVHARNFMVLEPGAQATVIEHYQGLDDGESFANSVTNISLGQDALLRHYKLQNEGLGNYHLSTISSQLERNASYDSFTLSLGAKLSRNEVSVRLAGEGSECHLNGAYLMRGRQHCDNTTIIDHMVPHTSCRETFKGVIDDQARAVFQGRIVVHKDAQQTNGHQLSKVLLLSNEAEIDAKPELEIYADDVLCSHGATAGDLDQEALFYLRARGIPEERARSILIEAFLAEAIQAIAAEGLCPALMTSIGHWLADT